MIYFILYPLFLSVITPYLADGGYVTIIQKTFENIVSKIPYLNTFVNTLDTTDYIIIGSIILVIALVIASVAKNKPHKMDKKSLRKSLN